MLARMTKIVKTAQAISWGPLLTLVLLVGHAAAAPLDENELSRWVPSISLETDLSFNKAQGQIQTTDVAGPFYEPPNPPATPVPIQPIIPTTPAEANTYMVTPSFGLIETRAGSQKNGGGTVKKTCSPVMPRLTTSTKHGCSGCHSAWKHVSSVTLT